ncbi:MAG: sigma-70 family RNA polymerase sigma factor [Deltaproteobacteria bacterium]|nr:sigma-70 family RNA polymerase sigma factor [Deltaproteobacteria bacterium]
MSINYKELKDAELVSKIKQGDGEAMEEIVKRYSDKVYNLAFHLTRDKAGAEEIMQDVFLTVLSKINTLRDDAYFSTWLYRVTANAAYGFLRALSKGKKGMDQGYPNDIEYESTYAYDWSTLPEDILLSDESKTMLINAIDELPESMRTVVIMKDIEGFKNEEIADAMGLSVPAVKSRLHRGRLVLRQRLSNYFKKYAQKDTIPTGTTR